VIDANDAIWNDLVVWQDSNQNGYSESGELLTLASLGIVSINVGDVVNVNENDGAITHNGTITTTGGEMRISNVLFDADFLNTRYVGEYTLDIDMLFLPTLRGYGTLADLHIVASMDTSLDSNGKRWWSIWAIAGHYLRFRPDTRWAWIIPCEFSTAPLTERQRLRGFVDSTGFRLEQKLR
jgi:hypothetical protein